MISFWLIYNMNIRKITPNSWFSFCGYKSTILPLNFRGVLDTNMSINLRCFSWYINWYINIVISSAYMLDRLTDVHFCYLDIRYIHECGLVANMFPLTILCPQGTFNKVQYITVCCWWLIWTKQNNLKKCRKRLELCCKLVLIWWCSAKAVEWIPTWQGLGNCEICLWCRTLDRNVDQHREG